MQVGDEAGFGMPAVRRYFTAVEEFLTEGGRAPARPIRRAAAAAVVANPWHAQGFVQRLDAAVAELAPQLARALSERLLTALGGAVAIEAFGKAALVGLDGELEHGAALIHTAYFGDFVRELTAGTSVIAFTDDRGDAGAMLTVPMWHKTAATTRSHYQSIAVRIAAAPRPDEIVIVAAAACAGRPHPRIGDRSTDPAPVTTQEAR